MGANWNRRNLVKALAALPLLGRWARADEKGAPPPFEPGEKLEYELGWQFLVAGRATTEVLPNSEIDGETVCNFKLSARTRSSIDKIFKVRDSMTSQTSGDVSRSLRFNKNQHEGKTRREEELLFDWENNKVLYEEKLGGKKRETDIEAGCLDPLSAFYHVRMQPMDVGTVITGPLTDGKRCKMAEIRVEKREDIKVNGKRYTCLKLVPDIQDVGGVFEKSKDASMEIWVTDDHRHVPVLMKSKVAVGSFVCKLKA